MSGNRRGEFLSHVRDDRCCVLIASNDRETYQWGWTKSVDSFEWALTRT